MKTYLAANLLGTAIRTEGEGYAAYHETKAEKAYLATSVGSKLVSVAAGVLTRLFTSFNPIDQIKKVATKSKKA